jgi:hypothetical protein
VQKVPQKLQEQLHEQQFAKGAAQSVVTEPLLLVDPVKLVVSVEYAHQQNAYQLNISVDG